MFHLSNSPARQNPLKPAAPRGCSESQVHPSPSLLPPSTARSRQFSQTLSAFQAKERDTSSVHQAGTGENIKPRWSGPATNDRLRSIKANLSLHFNPPSTPPRPKDGTSILCHGIMLPVPPFPQDVTANARAIEESTAEDEASLIANPLAAPPPYASPDSQDFLAMINDKLQFERSSPVSAPDLRRERARSTSSNYPTDGHDSAQLQSPSSPQCLVNRLSPSDLARYGQRNDRLSILRSSTASSTPHTVSETVSSQEAVVEAAAAITEWQAERPRNSLPYSHHELSESFELLPSDSLSQRSGRCSAVHASSTASTKVDTAPVKEVPGVLHKSILSIKQQYDGTTEHQRLDSPDFAAPPRSMPEDGFLGRSKRKASQFSLRSLATPFAKRPRLGIKNLASRTYRGSTRRFSNFRQAWKQNGEQEQREFEAWRAERRRERPADPLKGKIEKGHAQFMHERSRWGDKEWWKDGVSRYRAPSWMVFGR